MATAQSNSNKKGGNGQKKPYLSLKSANDEINLFNSRSHFALVFVAVLLLALISRFFYLQVVQYNHYQNLARKNYHRLITIPPVRGQIYDRNNIPLATNEVEYVLEVVKERVKDFDKQMALLNQRVEIDEETLTEIKRKYKSHPKHKPLLMRRDLNKREMAYISANRVRLPGFDIGVRMERVYPLKNVASHIIGYVGKIDQRDKRNVDELRYESTTHIGKLGVEKQYESRLHGTPGIRKIEVDSHGEPREVLSETEPHAGEDIYLSIDLRLQIRAEELLSKYTGALVAIDTRNGEVLAMASKPDYDVNQFVNGISYGDYNTLRDNPKNPLLNRAIQGKYSPGSTIKPAIGLVGLAMDLVSPSTKVNGRGYFQINNKGRRFRCWLHSGHGMINLNRAIYQSCDVYFYDLAYHMGIDRLSKAMNEFGFGVKTGIDMPHEHRANMPTRAWKEDRYKKDWFPGDTVNAGIGQGFWTSTPLQLAYMTSIIASEGQRFKPRLLHAVRKAKNLPKHKVSAIQISDLSHIEKKHWQEAKKGMRAVVHSGGGTAKKIGYTAPYRFAGKTGTVQVVSIAQNKKYDASRLRKELHDHSLFVAFAPYDKPRVAVAVILENAGGGSKVAAPLARRFLDTFMATNIDDLSQQTEAAEDVVDQKAGDTEEDAQAPVQEYTFGERTEQAEEDERAQRQSINPVNSEPTNPQQQTESENAQRPMAGQTLRADEAANPSSMSPSSTHTSTMSVEKNSISTPAMPDAQRPISPPARAPTPPAGRVSNSAKPDPVTPQARPVQTPMVRPRRKQPSIEQQIKLLLEGTPSN